VLRDVGSHCKFLQFGELKLPKPFRL
jgi:hypothetical protein